jgi:hypothetical protein
MEAHLPWEIEPQSRPGHQRPLVLFGAVEVVLVSRLLWDPMRLHQIEAFVGDQQVWDHLKNSVSRMTDALAVVGSVPGLGMPLRILVPTKERQQELTASCYCGSSSFSLENNTTVAR